MNYTFPVINTIEDVLPHIEGKEEFIVIDKGDYKIIDYIFQSPLTFPPINDGNLEKWEEKILRECRGIAFDKEGKILSRPFHKFFNYGEKPEEQAGCGLPAHMLEKLDGSMIRPLVIDGDIRFGTRKGITEVAMQAETFAAGKDSYINLISAFTNTGYTPIFEWCSRKNQIVLDYPEENLILLAIRNNDTGEYLEYSKVKQSAEQFDVPVVEACSFQDSDWFASAKDLTDKEGYVFVWENGHRVKAKSDWYTMLHKAKDAIGREKDLIKLYLTTGVDDLLPILPEAYKKEVQDFLIKLTEEIVKTCQRLDGIFVNTIEKLPNEFTRKDFALQVQRLAPKYKPFMFSLLPGRQCMEVVVPVLIKACSNKKALEEYRWLIGGIRFGEKGVEV